MVYPPYCDICTLTFTSEYSSKAFSGATCFFDMIKEAVTGEYNDVKVNLLGPLQPRVSKINNKYRYVLTVKCKNNKRFREMVSALIVKYMKHPRYSDVSLSVDINAL